MPLPKLEFGKTSLLGDGADLGTDLPDPDTIEYSSPDRDAVSDESPVISDADPAAADEAAIPNDQTDQEYASEEEPHPVGAGATDDSFTAELLEQAQQYGYDAEAARRFGSPENLQWAMADADRRAAEWGRQQLAPEPPATTPPASAATPPASAPSAPPQAESVKQFSLDKEKLTAQGFDEDTIELLTGMNDYYQQQLSTMQQLLIAHHQGLTQITGQSQADEEAQFERDMDAYFDGLGTDWEAEFGKGPMRSLDPNSPAAAKRREVAATVFGLQVSDAQLNRGQLPTPQLAQRAINALHFKKQQELARKATAGAVGARRSQAIARPGGQRGVPVTGEEKAIKRAEAFARKHNLAAVG